MDCREVCSLVVVLSSVLNHCIILCWCGGVRDFSVRSTSWWLQNECLILPRNDVMSFHLPVLFWRWAQVREQERELKSHEQLALQYQREYDDSKKMNQFYYGSQHAPIFINKPVLNVKSVVPWFFRFSIEMRITIFSHSSISITHIILESSQTRHVSWLHVFAIYLWRCFAGKMETGRCRQQLENAKRAAEQVAAITNELQNMFREVCNLSHRRSRVLLTLQSNYELLESILEAY